MKNFSKKEVQRFFLLFSVVLLNSACAHAQPSEPGTSSAFVKEKRLTDDQLYAVCKEDLSAPDFETTRCGMYLQGFRTASFMFLYPFIPISASREGEPSPIYQGSGNETIDGMVEIYGASCKSGPVPLKKTAEDFMINLDNQKLKKSKLQSDPETYFWAYFMSCGNPSLVAEKSK